MAETTADRLAVDIVRESALWDGAPDAETVIRRALSEAASEVSSKASELAIVLADDSAIRALNAKWRGVDKATNVLSFPAKAQGAGLVDVVHLGDIVIAFETTSAEALAQSKPLAHHLAHLVIHGYLHLVGYDHENDGEAEDMERLETKLLARVGVPDPYANTELQ